MGWLCIFSPVAFKMAVSVLMVGLPRAEGVSLNALVLAFLAEGLGRRGTPRTSEAGEVLDHATRLGV